MSMRQLLGGDAVAMAVFIVGALVIGRSAPRLRGVNAMCCGYVAALLAMLLSMFRGSLPPYLAIVMGNSLLLFAYTLIHRSTEQVLGVRSLLPRFSAIVYPLYVAGLVYYTFWDRELSARIFILSAGICLQTAVTALILYRQRDPELRLPARLQAALLMTISLLAAGRFVVTAVWPPGQDFLKASAMQEVYTYLNMIFGLALSGGVLWLSLCAQRNEWRTIAQTDGLTGLMNRRTFEDCVGREIARLSGESGSFGVLLLDIDHFKAVNDQHGHLAGDEVIRQVGKALQATMRPSDVLARYGGEEFVLLLRGTDITQAHAAAERMRRQVELLDGLPGGQRVTASIGVALGWAESTVEDLIRRADDALYLSKRAGRNRVTCEPETERKAHPDAATPAMLL